MNLDAEVLTLKDRVSSLEVTERAFSQRVEKLEVQLSEQSSMLKTQTMGESQPAIVLPPPVQPPGSQSPIIESRLPVPPHPAMGPAAVNELAGPTTPAMPPPPNLSSAALPQPAGLDPQQLPPPLSTHPVAYPQPLPPSGSATSAPTVAISSETLLRWAGLVLVSLAAIFFVSTAINRGWIGPELQLAGAVAVGIGLHATAIRLESRARNWAYTLAHGATVVLAWSAAASYQWLGLVSIEIGLALLALTAVVSTAIATKFRFSSVVLSAGLISALMPLWMDIFGSASPTVAAFWYCLIGVVYAGFGLWQRWPEVRILVSWVCLGIVSLGFLFGPSFDESQGKVPGLIALTGLTAALWIGPWVQAKVANSGEYKEQRDEFDRIVKALDHRSTLALPGMYLAASAILLSSGSSTGIGRLGLLVAAGFTAVLAIAMVVAPPKLLLASKAPSRRWSMPDSLAVSHLFGIGTVLVIAAVDLLDGPTLLLAVALQAFGTAAVAAYFKDVVLGAKAILLASIGALVSVAWMVEAIADADQLDVGRTSANFMVVATLVGFAMIARYVTTPGPPVSTDAELSVTSPQPAQGWQWWSRRRPVVELADGVAWAAGLVWIASVVTVLANFSLNPGLLALFAGLSVIAYRLLGRLVLLTGVALFVVGVAVGGLGIFIAYFEAIDIVKHGNHLVVVLCLMAVAGWAWTRPEGRSDSPARGVTPDTVQPASQSRGANAILADEPYRAISFGLAWVGGLAWLGSVLISGPQGQVAVSASWAVAGCVALLAGIRFNEQTVRFTGLATLGVVVVKLLTVDLAEVETLWRVGLFFLLGLGFMRLGYVLPKLVQRYAADDEQTVPASDLPIG